MSNDASALDTQRSVIRSCRFTAEEWSAVKERAAAAGLSPSRFLRQVSLGAPLGRRINAEAVVALNRVGVNLNHLVRLALRDGKPLLAADATEVLGRLRRLLESLL